MKKLVISTASAVMLLGVSSAFARGLPGRLRAADLWVDAVRRSTETP